MGKLTSKLHISCIIETSLQCFSSTWGECWNRPVQRSDATGLWLVKSGQKTLHALLSQTLKSSCCLLWLLKSFGLHAQPRPCSFCSNLQGRSWWLRSHLIISAGAVNLCNRSRHSGYCWSEAFLKQEQGEADGTGHTLSLSLCWGEVMLLLIGWLFISSVWKYLFRKRKKKPQKGQVIQAGNTLHQSFDVTCAAGIFPLRL